MSARAPMLGNETITEAFKKGKDNPDFGYLQIGIDLDENKFILVTEQTSTGDAAQDWENIKSILEPKQHSYFVVRDPVDPKLYVLVHFGPDLSPVKQRMMYASSRASLKNFLGASSFSEDYYMNTSKDCSVQALIDQRTLHKKIDFRSDSEIEKHQATHESAPKTTHSQVMKNLPTELEESGKHAIDRFKNDQVKTVFLSLKTENQAVVGTEHKEEDVDSIRALLSENDPKYILFWYEDSNDEESIGPVRVFGYYCPEKADRKEKFTYSTCKANIIDYCTSIGLEFHAKVEISITKDFGTEFLDYHVFPKKEEKEAFATPKAPGKKPKGKKKLNVQLEP